MSGLLGESVVQCAYNMLSMLTSSSTTAGRIGKHVMTLDPHRPSLEHLGTTYRVPLTGTFCESQVYYHLLTYIEVILEISFLFQLNTRSAMDRGPPSGRCVSQLTATPYPTPSAHAPCRGTPPSTQRLDIRRDGTRIVDIQSHMQTFRVAVSYVLFSFMDSILMSHCWRYPDTECDAQRHRH